MHGGRVMLLGVCACIVLVFAVLVAVACGGETTTTAAPVTTAAPTITEAPTTTMGGASAGPVLYEQYCKECHADGVGGLASSIADIVTNGVGTMPGFADRLTPEEIAAVADWAAGGGN